MMREFLNTFKFLLKQNFSINHFKNKIKNNKRQKTMFIIVAIALLMSLPSYLLIISMFVKMFDILHSINQSSFFLVMAIMLSVFVIGIFGIYSVISYFYFSNEVKILTPLPIKTKHILISKFFVLYAFELLINIFVILPFFIIYGIKSGIGIISWLYLVVSFLLLPIIPLVIIGIITVLLMKFTNVFKNKETFRMVGMFILLIGIISVQFGFNKIITSSMGNDQEFFLKLFENNHFLIDKIALYYPVISLVVNAIDGNFLWATYNIIILLLVSAFAIYLFGLFLQKIFLNSYLKEQENNKSRNKRKQNININKNAKVSLSVTKIDFLTLLRTPIYFFNCLITIILVPIILIISPLFSGNTQFTALFALYEENTKSFWLILTLGITVFSTLNQIAPTTFSREGKTNWIMRTLPISSKDNLLGRFYTSFFAQIAFSIITIGIILIFLKTGFIFALIAFILSTLASIPLLLLGIYIDLKRPYLDWDNPQQAVKQNMNVLISMGIGMIYAFIFVFAHILLAKFLHLEIIVIFYIILNIIIAYFVYKFVLKSFSKSLVIME